MAADHQIKKPRVLVADSSPGVTGALNSVLRSCEHLRGSFDFTFLLPSGSAADETIRAHGYEVIAMPLKELRKSAGSMLAYLPVLISNGIRIKRLVRSRGFNIVLVNDFYNLAPSAAVWMGARVPLVTYVRFIPTRFPKWLVRLWVRAHEKTSTCFVAVSNAVARCLTTSLPVHVVPNEIPTYQESRADMQSNLILFPANYIDGKGQEYALHAFKRVTHDFPDWKIRFVGGDLGLQKNRDFKKDLQSLARMLEIDSQTEWLDFQTDMRAQYAASSFVLMLSDSESFSMVCLEAMHCSRPVIATRCGGPDEIIDDHKDGLLVPVRDIDAIAAGMTKLMKGADLRAQLGDAAKKKVIDRYSIEKSAGRLSEIYESALR
jgi:glycosyltransferase involved in cell wall biosynthesis